MPRFALTGLAIAIGIGGVLALAMGNTAAGAVGIAVAIVSGLAYGARGGPRSHEQGEAAETEAAKTSAISRWRTRS